MYAVNTYEEIEENERALNSKHIIVFLFVRPSLAGADKIIAEFNYLHYNSGRHCMVYAVGYSKTRHANFADTQEVKGVDHTTWYYSDMAFVQFKEKLEKRLKWRYSGETEMIILQSNPQGSNILNFENYLVVDVNYGIKNNYIDSFPRFMEALIRSAREEKELLHTLQEVQFTRYKLTDIIAGCIDECKKIPQPVRKIVKDRLFYRTARSY